MSPVPRVPMVDGTRRWLDQSRAISEEAAFVGPPDRQILAFLHRPVSGANAGAMLLCGSLYEDLQVNYRAELLLARKLASSGFAVARFHYRGSGNSDGAPGGAPTFSSLMEDASVARRWLHAQVRAETEIVCGFRVGALVASEVAQANATSSLVLWAPATSGAEYFRVMARRSMIAGVRDVGRRNRAPATLEQRLIADGWVELLGHRVFNRSYADLCARVLSPALGPGHRVLLLEVGLAETGSPELDRLAQDWTGRGMRLDRSRVRVRQPWFVPERWEPEEDRPEIHGPVEAIAAWTVAHHGAAGSVR